MNRHRLLTHCCRLGLLAVLALTVACSTPATPNPPPPATVAATDVPPTAAPAQADLVPASAACDSLEQAVLEALGAQIEVSEAPFSDPLSDKVGSACELAARGTGAELESVDLVMGTLELVFDSHGWTEDTHYIADGPTGTARGFRQGDVLAIASVMWEPSPDADCPDDMLISDCDLEPEQMLYTITIQCVQGLDGV